METKIDKNSNSTANNNTKTNENNNDNPNKNPLEKIKKISDEDFLKIQEKFFNKVKHLSELIKKEEIAKKLDSLQINLENFKKFINDYNLRYLKNIKDEQICYFKKLIESYDNKSNKVKCFNLMNEKKKKINFLLKQKYLTKKDQNFSLIKSEFSNDSLEKSEKEVSNKKIIERIIDQSSNLIKYNDHMKIGLGKKDNFNFGDNINLKQNDFDNMDLKLLEAKKINSNFLNSNNLVNTKSPNLTYCNYINPHDQIRSDVEKYVDGMKSIKAKCTKILKNINDDTDLEKKLEYDISLFKIEIIKEFEKYKRWKVLIRSVIEKNKRK
jgi:hypothetical protein